LKNKNYEKDLTFKGEATDKKKKEKNLG